MSVFRQCFVWVATILLLGSAGARADVFRILDDPRDAAQARVDLFQQAHHEIDALYFLARDDRITFAALALLRDARRRGVESVRLIVDADFQHIPKGVLAYLNDEGIEIRVYHPLTLRHPSWIFKRMHDKVVVVDEARYITGGRNLAEDYFGLGKEKNFVDRDVYVEGESAAEADRHFEALWSSSHVVALHVRASAEEKAEAAKTLDGALVSLVSIGLIQVDTGRDWSAGENAAVPVRFLHDPVAKDDDRGVAPELAKLIDDAKDSIVIESAYLIPSTALLELLEKKTGEGVKITILTNSMRSTDGVLPQAAYLRHRRRVLRAGIDIREYKGRDTLHSKSAVIDGRIAIVGSYNIDPRSENLNTEVMCMADDPATASALMASIEHDMGNAWVIRKGHRNDHNQGMSAAARVRAWFAHLFVPIVQGQL